MSTEREHLIDPTTLDDRTVVELEHSSGERTLYYISGAGYVTWASAVGDGDPIAWGDWRIVRVLDTREEWEPLPDGPTDKHKGRMVRQVLNGVEMRGRLDAIESVGAASFATTKEGGNLGNPDWGKWSVLVEPEPADPDAALVRDAAERIDKLLTGGFGSCDGTTFAECEAVARAIIAAVREDGEKA